MLSAAQWMNRLTPASCCVDITFILWQTAFSKYGCNIISQPICSCRNLLLPNQDGKLILCPLSLGRLRSHLSPSGCSRSDVSESGLWKVIDSASTLSIGPLTPEVFSCQETVQLPWSCQDTSKPKGAHAERPQGEALRPHKGERRPTILHTLQLSAITALVFWMRERPWTRTTQASLPEFLSHRDCSR